MARRLAERVASLKPSATVEMTERVRAARASGRQIIPLSSGDPNIETDARIIAAAERAMRAGDTHYGPAQGLLALREAIVGREALRSGVHYDAADVIVTPGGKFALLTALMGVVEAGDEVLVPEPGWVSYGPCVRLCGGIPVALSMLDTIDEELLERRVSPRTKALILNSPVNPTGRVFSAEEIARVVGFAERHDLWIVFDQVYSDLLHEGRFPAAQSAPGAKERVLVVDSLSKTFGMTGWRLGYLALPKGTAKPILKFIQHSIYCVPGFIQSAAIEALSLYDELVPGYRRMFRHRLDLAAERLSAVDGITCRRPEATFYLFPSVAADDVEVARRWLETINVATLPGSSFGPAGAGHLRLSLTCSETDLDEALDRIARVGIAA
ncbi:MAG TPA: aminotransferase class I/II-fold pyridoxal phosphate-dependent enzyme [Beijerinckiaceae bacterium]|jgi:aspartate aminotransferase|nr:aminotransferase class I/II-fold pyridoxal phosphate-dependent enzyme [Beijerinckiaceae bacterium]